MVNTEGIITKINTLVKAEKRGYTVVESDKLLG